MGLMDFFIRPEPVSYGTAKGLNTLQINRTIPGIVELKCTDLRKKEGKGDEEDG